MARAIAEAAEQAAVTAQRDLERTRVVLATLLLSASGFDPQQPLTLRPPTSSEAEPATGKLAYAGVMIDAMEDDDGSAVPLDIVLECSGPRIRRALVWLPFRPNAYTLSQAPAPTSEEQP